LHELVRGYRYQGDEGDEEEDEQGHRQKKVYSHTFWVE
jgi:hypothetical protein